MRSGGSDDNGAFRREESLGYVVNHLGRLFARALDRRLDRHGVALGQFPALLILWEQEGITQSEIARRLDIEQPTVANTLKRMERDGLVAFGADPANKRQVLVTLTDKGRALRAPLIAEAEAVNSQASEDFSAAESARFLALLRRMAANLDRDE
jgi:DNA-binding MarR family transcriptional regulator